MKVNIGVLKNELSKYLNEVRAGKEVIVTDHNEPIAKILPFNPSFKVVDDFRAWLKENPPLVAKKTQPPSVPIIRQLRDEGR